MEGNTTALLWITIAAFALLIITVALVFWPALGRRWHALLYNEAPHPPSMLAETSPRPVGASQAPPRPVAAPAPPPSVAPARVASAPAPFVTHNAGAVTGPPPLLVDVPAFQVGPQHRSFQNTPPAPPLLDLDDPTVRRYEQVVAEVEQTFAAVRTLPEGFDERSSMRVEVMAVEQQLVELKALLAEADPGGRAGYRPLIRGATERLSSIRRDVEAISTALAQLADQERELHEAAVALSDELNSIAHLAPYPIATERTSELSANVLGQVTRLPGRSALRSFNGLKVRLRLVKELREAVEGCRETLASSRRHREALLELLAAPELADDAPWHRTLKALNQRSRAVGEGRTGSDGIEGLMAEADHLLARRHALFDFCTPMPQGGVLLPEERLPAIRGEAEAVRSEVRSLWQRARASVAK